MHRRRNFTVGVAVGLTSATVLACLAGPGALASADSSHPSRVVVPGTGLGSLAATHSVHPLRASDVVRVSVFVNQDRAALAPAGKRYRIFLDPGQVARRFGATPTERSAVASWLRANGLHLTHNDPFNVTAIGAASAAAQCV